MMTMMTMTTMMLLDHLLFSVVGSPSLDELGVIGWYSYLLPLFFVLPVVLSFFLSFD